MLIRPLQHEDVALTHCQPNVFDDSPQSTNGVSFVACEVFMYQYAKTNTVRSSNITLDGGQDFPSVATLTPPENSTVAAASAAPKTPDNSSIYGRNGITDEELAEAYLNEEGDDEHSEA